METFSQIKTKLLSKNPKYTFPFGIYASKEAYAYAYAYAYYAFAYIFYKCFQVSLILPLLPRFA